jgi:hypothetical protein
MDDNKSDIVSTVNNVELLTVEQVKKMIHKCQKIIDENYNNTEDFILKLDYLISDYDFLYNEYLKVLNKREKHKLYCKKYYNSTMPKNREQAGLDIVIKKRYKE